MNKSEVDQILSEVTKMNQNLTKLIGEARSRLLSLQPEQREKLQEVEQEILNVQDAMKTGDHAVFEKILNKYAR